MAFQSLGIKEIVYGGGRVTYASVVLGNNKIFQPYALLDLPPNRELEGSVVIGFDGTSKEGYSIRSEITRLYLEPGKLYAFQFPAVKNYKNNSSYVFWAKRLSNFSCPTCLPQAFLELIIDTNEDGS